jgi:hypothetical protein
MAKAMAMYSSTMPIDINVPRVVCGAIDGAVMA